MGRIYCVPEVRPEYGYGHIARQCVLVNYLRMCGRESFLVVPERFLEDQSKIAWLHNRIHREHLLPCALVKFQEYLVDSSDRVVIDSYDLTHTAQTIGCDPKVDLLTVFDDTAYEREYSKNIVPVIPNVCGNEQQKKIMIWNKARFPKLTFGPDHVLVHPAFVLSEEDRIRVLTERRSRILACQKSKAPLVILLGFGGSASASKNPIVNDNIPRLLQALRYSCNNIEVRCLGSVPDALTSDPKISIQKLKWMDVDSLAAAYLDSDLYIGAVGYAMWERASLLLPSFVLPISDNQIPYAQTGEELGIHKIALYPPQDTWFSDGLSMQTAAAELQFNCSAYQFLFN